MTFRSFCVVFVLVVSLAACKASSTHGTGKGTVAAVDLAKSEITLDHGDIPGIMGAMTMTYAVPDKKVLEGVAPGAKVEFDLKVVNGEQRVTAIRVQ
ncbi:MAG: heavy metal efflux pump, CzcA family [Deltaproteobacteria bacterium]|nr:heavy metal efflux pump, CzcA family [Deltaproteobacteria bacterium]